MQINITQPNYNECYLDNNNIPGNTVFNNKLFHNDICNYDELNNLTLVKSNRHTFLIGGILKLTNNIYYKDPKSNKYLYEFYPINWRYPKFMVKSEIKNNLIKKNEKIEDQFIVIQYKEWTNKYPSGITYKLIGEITNVVNMYEVLFYYHPEQPYEPPQKIKIDILDIPKKNDVCIDTKIILEKYNLPELDQIYSIDPIGCKDIDDALSYDSKNNCIGIHISDVNYTIEYLHLKFNKYSTIYAPHKHLNMIPDELSYDYCSLLTGKTRPVITCWIHLDTFKVTFERHFIKVKYNLNYDQSDNYLNNIYDIKLLNNDEIQVKHTLEKLFTFSIQLNDKYKYVDNIHSSHEMVQVYMIFVNQYISMLLSGLKNTNIIYRNQFLNKPAEYSYENHGHISMNVKSYTHFTSPIRRIVDQYVHKIFINEYFDGNMKIEKLDVDKINEFELNLKKVTILWNYITVSDKIKNGFKYTLEFLEFDSNKSRVEFNLLEHKIVINNKILFTILDNNTICIYNKTYQLGKTYDLPLYVVKEIKNQNFPKIIIKF
jgi:exoribonuclease R